MTPAEQEKFNAMSARYDRLNKMYTETYGELGKAQEALAKMEEWAPGHPYIGCAANTISGVSYTDPVEVMKRQMKNRYSFLVFVDNNHKFGDGMPPPGINSGENLANVIKKEELGEIWESDWRRNMFYGHATDNKERAVKVWIWYPDWKKVEAYAKKG